MRSSSFAAGVLQRIVGSEIMGVVEGDGSFRNRVRPVGKGRSGGRLRCARRMDACHRTGVGRRPQTGPDLLQGRFADPRHPLLHAKVEAEENQLSPY